VKSASRAIWIVALAVGVLWPSPVLSPLDGIPLNGAFEAVLLGVALPAVVWLNPVGLRHPIVRIAIVGLLLLKAVALIAVPQQGLCARFTTIAPFRGVISTIDIDEPSGLLRSWDIRADWRSASPRCTAIFDRPYASRDRFPIWFVNLLQALRPDGEVDLDIDGYVNVNESGTFSIDRGADLALAGSLGSVPMSVAGTALSAAVPAGSHRLQLHGSSRGSNWQFIPHWNGRNAYAAANLTTLAPNAVAAAIARPLSMAITLIVAALFLALVVGCATSRGLVGPGVGFGFFAAFVLSALAVTGRFERLAPLLLAGGVMVPIRRHQQSMRIAFLLLGIPWLTFFVVRSLPQLESVTTYSTGDDWHMYQSAAYSIFLNGQWLRGGSDVFLFQPLYRWTVGLLHLIFGDPSVGETYLDAAGLLASALLGFALVKPVAGFRAAIAAAALTLATFTIGPIWYLIGRGLSEIAALGWMSLAVMFLLRARLGRSRSAAFAGAFAVVMFLTRLNHLLLAGFLLAALLPLRAPSALRQLSAAIDRVRVRTAAVYTAIVVVGILLYSTRTWWYSGHFSVTYGTSFGVQQTGLRPSTIMSPTVWTRVGEAFAAQLSMHEPPAFDPRAVLLVVGAILSVLALLQLPWANRLPAGLALLTFGTLAGSFVAHTHEYPGRMSVHVVPFAVAMSVCAAARLIRDWNPSTHKVH
jgi:hypothetical protein